MQQFILHCTFCVDVTFCSDYYILWCNIVLITIATTDCHWAIPENIHTQPRTASMFYPPLAFGNSKMRYPPMPSEFHNREPPLPFRIYGFFWKYIFDLATPIRTNEHEFMPPQGCDLAAPGDKLYSSVTRKTYASCQAVQTPF